MENSEGSYLGRLGSLAAVALALGCSSPPNVVRTSQQPEDIQLLTLVETGKLDQIQAERRGKLAHVQDPYVRNDIENQCAQAVHPANALPVQGPQFSRICIYDEKGNKFTPSNAVDRNTCYDQQIPQMLTPQQLYDYVRGRVQDEVTIVEPCIANEMRQADELAGVSLREIDVTDENLVHFQTEVLKRKGIVVIDFFATWCEPCKHLAPILVQVAKRHNLRHPGTPITIARVDTTEAGGYESNAKNRKATKELSGSYEPVIPQLHFYKDGKYIGYAIGNKSRAELEAELHQILAESERRSQ